MVTCSAVPDGDRVKVRLKAEPERISYEEAQQLKQELELVLKKRKPDDG